MRQTGKIKEKISVKKIGKEKFLLGIIAGIISAIAISLVFNYTRELFRMTTCVFSDLQILKPNELLFFNYFFASLSSASGFSITIWIWMNNHHPKGRLKRVLSITSGMYANVLFWIVLMMFSRLGPIFSLFFYHLPGFQETVNFYENYKILFIFLPIVIFLQNWLMLRLIYRSGRWMIISFALCVILTFILKRTTEIDQQKFNNLYFNKYKTEYRFIAEEVERAKKEYGIEYNKQTIEDLRNYRKENSLYQVKSVKSAFNSEKPVSLDTILLQKILIRNFKWSRLQSQNRNDIKNFYYAYPYDILRQIYNYPVQSEETRELFAVLKEEIDLINTPSIDWKSKKEYSETEIYRSDGAKRHVPYKIYDQLVEVRKRLINDKRFYEFNKYLPEIKKENEYISRFREMDNNANMK